MSGTVAVVRQRDASTAEFELARPQELLESQQVYTEMAQRAYDLFQARDCNGTDCEDWFRAARTRILLNS